MLQGYIYFYNILLCLSSPYLLNFPIPRFSSIQDPITLSILVLLEILMLEECFNWNHLLLYCVLPNVLIHIRGYGLLFFLRVQCCGGGEEIVDIYGLNG